MNDAGICLLILRSQAPDASGEIHIVVKVAS